MFSSSSSNYCHCHKLSYQYHHLQNHHFMHNVEEVWYLQDYPKLTLVFHTVHILVPTEHVQFITAFENFCLISFTFSWAVSFTLFIISFSFFFFFLMLGGTSSCERYSQNQRQCSLLDHKRDINICTKFSHHYSSFRMYFGLSASKFKSIKVIFDL